MDFQGKTVLITGGSRGIGRATAIAFAAKGARVAINFRQNKEAAYETCDLLEGEGHFAIKADIAKPSAVEGMVDRVIAEFQHLDILVNNAGIFEAHPIDDSNYDDWQKAWNKTLRTNLVAPANICFCAAQHMMSRKNGHIINVSSRGAFRGEPGQPAYGASKAGLNALTQSLAQALAPYHIAVSAVAPGFVETDMAKEILDGPDGPGIKQQSPMNRVALPEEVAHAILFLASEQAVFTTGTIIDVNGASYLRM